MSIQWTPQRLDSLVSLFGGINPLARALNFKHRSTVKQWIERGNIPIWRLREIREAAAREGITLPKWFNGGPP